MASMITNVRNFFQRYAFLSLSVLFLFSVILNITFQARTIRIRELANIDSASNENNLNDYILRSLSSSDNDMEIIFSKKPSHEDKLVFETLVGSYDVLKSGGKITAIQLKPGYEALKAPMLASVLTQYRKALGINKLSFRMVSELNLNPNKEYQYELTVDQQVIGKMSVSLNPKNEISSLSTKFN